MYVVRVAPVKRSEHDQIDGLISNDKTGGNISFPVKIKYKSYVASILLYGCKSLTLTAETEWQIQAFEYKGKFCIKVMRNKINVYFREGKFIWGTIKNHFLHFCQL